MQEPWAATSIGWDTTDLTLDVVVDGDGAITFKDEDELEWAQLQACTPPVREPGSGR